MPCWYELSWRNAGGEQKLLLRIHGDFVSSIKEIPADALVVGDFMNEFKFKTFGGRFGADMGFEGSLKYQGTAGEFLEYEIPTPLVKKFKNEPCVHCGGMGYDEILRRDCLFCEKGRESYYDWEPAFAVSASLTLLFMIMRFPKEETNAEVPQLMRVDTATTKESYGGWISGEYGRELAAYLRFRPTGSIPEMVSAMKTVFSRMEGNMPNGYEGRFEAHVRSGDGWLNVSCPGDAAGLHPESDIVDRGCGYKFSCHNVDQPMQQLMLLASLAALHDLARVALAKDRERIWT